MPKISTYNTVTPQGTDKIIISQENGTPTNVTKNITVDGLKGYINPETIPTPYIYTLKNTGPFVDINEQQKVCIQKPIETKWLTKNPRLFLYRYSQTISNNYGTFWKRRGFVHPSHNNGEYQRANFTGTNWGSAINITKNNEVIHPIDTEWDINTELKIAKTGTIITDFASLRQSTYIEIPFSKLQFLYSKDNPEVPYTSFPVSTGNPGGFCTISPKNGKNNNTRTPYGNNNRYNKLILKFAIGIPNPTWTNTNHELPYIMGELSNPIQMVYQKNSSETQFSGVKISQGSNATVDRKSN
jgi:hypothetical protein